MTTGGQTMTDRPPGALFLRVFMVMGLTAAPAVIVWDCIARRLGDIDALILCSMLHISGIVLPIGGTLAAAMAGAVLFGATFIGLVSLVLSMVEAVMVVGLLLLCALRVIARRA